MWITQLCYSQKCHSYVVWERVFNNCKETKIKVLHLGFIFYFICFLIIDPRCLVILTDHLLISFFEKMYILILILPLLSFLICIGFGRKIGELGSTHLSCTLVLLWFILVVCDFDETLICGSSEYINVRDWFSGGLLFCMFSLKYDGITLSMLILVSGVFFLVHLFSVGYMKGVILISQNLWPIYHYSQVWWKY